MESSLGLLQSTSETLLNDNGSGETRKNLPIKGGNKTSLSKSTSKTGVLGRMNADVFNIVSSLSSSERTIGAWVVSKEDYLKLVGMYQKINDLYLSVGRDPKWWLLPENIPNNGSQHLEVYKYANDKRIVLEFKRSKGTNFRDETIWAEVTKLDHPSIRRTLEKNGVNILDLMGDFSNFTIECKKRLKLQDLDTNITHLNYFDGTESEIDFSHLKHLKYLECNSSKLKKINLKSNTELRFLDVSHNFLEDLDLKNLHNLEKLDCSFNKLTVLDLSENEAIWCINAANNFIKNLCFPSEIPDDFDGLELDCRSNCISLLDLRSFVNSCYSDINVHCDSTVSIAYKDPVYDDSGEHEIGFEEKTYTVNNTRTAVSLDEEPPLIIFYHNIFGFSLDYGFLEEFWKWCDQLGIRESEKDQRNFLSEKYQSGKTISSLLAIGTCSEFSFEIGKEIQKLHINLRLKKIFCRGLGLRRLTISEYNPINQTDDPVLLTLDCRDNNLKEIDLTSHEFLVEVMCDAGTNVILHPDLNREEVINES